MQARTKTIKTLVINTVIGKTRRLQSLCAVSPETDTPSTRTGTHTRLLTIINISTLKNGLFQQQTTVDSRSPYRAKQKYDDRLQTCTGVDDRKPPDSYALMGNIHEMKTNELRQPRY